MGIDTDIGSQTEGRATWAESCKEQLGGNGESSSCELSGISEGEANCPVSRRAGTETQIGGREEQERMRELFKKLRILSQKISS